MPASPRFGFRLLGRDDVGIVPYDEKYKNKKITPTVLKVGVIFNK